MMSCFSIRTGYSSFRSASAWNSLQDLLVEQKMVGLNLNEQISEVDLEGNRTNDEVEVFQQLLFSIFSNINLEPRRK
jgi:hypothetical protein